MGKKLCTKAVLFAAVGLVLAVMTGRIEAAGSAKGRVLTGLKIWYGPFINGIQPVYRKKKKGRLTKTITGAFYGEKKGRQVTLEKDGFIIDGLRWQQVEHKDEMVTNHKQVGNIFDLSVHFSRFENRSDSSYSRAYGYNKNKNIGLFAPYEVTYNYGQERRKKLYINRLLGRDYNSKNIYTLVINGRAGKKKVNYEGRIDQYDDEDSYGDEDSYLNEEDSDENEGVSMPGFIKYSLIIGMPLYIGLSAWLRVKNKDTVKQNPLLWQSDVGSVTLFGLAFSVPVVLLALAATGDTDVFSSSAKTPVLNPFMLLSTLGVVGGIAYAAETQVNTKHGDRNELYYYTGAAIMGLLFSITSVYLTVPLIYMASSVNETGATDSDLRLYIGLFRKTW